MPGVLVAAPLAFLAALPVAVAADAMLGAPGPVAPMVLVTAAGAILVAAVFLLPRRAALGGGALVAAFPLFLLGPGEAAFVRLVAALACIAVAWEVTRRGGQGAPQS